MQKIILPDDIVVSLYNSEYSLTSIGKMLHCSRMVVVRVLKENNVKLRTLIEVKQNNKTNEQISESLMGHEISEATREKISNTLTGRKLTVEHKKNIAIASTGRHCHSEEWKRKLGDRYRGEHLSAKTRKKISDTKTGCKLSETTKDKIREARANQVLPIKDTSPEIYIQELLTFNNIPFEKHKFIPGLLPKEIKNHRFDIVINESNLLIEIQGCFWHGCSICFPELMELQKKAISRDVIIRRAIQNQSEWKLKEIWECDINKIKNYNINMVKDKIFSKEELKK